MKSFCILAILFAATSALAQMPTPDQRVQQNDQRYRDAMDTCERHYQEAMRLIADPTRHHIANAEGLARERYKNCQNWAETNFRYGGKLRYQPH